MKRPMIALLLNALLLPGMGQFYLGRKTKGIALIIAVNLLLFPALFLIMKIASPIIGAQLTGAPLTAPQILAAVQPYATWAKLLLAAFLALWGYGVVDLVSAFRDPDQTSQN